MLVHWIRRVLYATPVYMSERGERGGCGRGLGLGDELLQRGVQRLEVRDDRVAVCDLVGDERLRNRRDVHERFDELLRLEP